MSPVPGKGSLGVMPRHTQDGRQMQSGAATLENNRALVKNADENRHTTRHFHPQPREKWPYAHTPTCTQTLAAVLLSTGRTGPPAVPCVQGDAPSNPDKGGPAHATTQVSHRADAEARTLGSPLP